MAKDDKTEKATPKRQGEARKKGQVAKSPDLNGSAVLIAGLIATIALGPAIFAGAGRTMHDMFGRIARPGAVSTAAGLNVLLHELIQTLLTTAAPIAGVCAAAGLLANVAQVGFKPRLTVLKPDFKRLNPAAGAKNLLASSRAPFELVKSLIKVAVVGAVAAMALLPQLTNLGASVGTPPGALARLLGSNVVGIAERAALAYLLIGVVDFVYQRRRHNRQLRMSKQEVKEETKMYSLPPEVRAAIRRRQIQAARARMMAAVPNADVVVTNPTHYAVALQYDGSCPAPVVVAKGQGYVALEIRRIAEEHDVAIVPDPPLARALHKSVELDQMIPEELYAAVAQVLAFVYRMAARKKVAV